MSDELDTSTGEVYRPDALPLDEDSQMSFNAEQFFQTNFHVSGEIAENATAMDGDLGVLPQTDVINHDLQLSESDDGDDDQPSEGTGFDFDDFDDDKSHDADDL